MKTTFELPEDLVTQIKSRAAQEQRDLGDLVAELLRSGLEHGGAAGPPRHRVTLPLVPSIQRPSGEELTPERVAEILIREEEGACFEAMR